MVVASAAVEPVAPAVAVLAAPAVAVLVAPAAVVPVAPAAVLLVAPAADQRLLLDLEGTRTELLLSLLAREGERRRAAAFG